MTFMAAVKAKKMVSRGVSFRKLQTDGDEVKSPIIVKIEKTKYLKEVNIVFIFGVDIRYVQTYAKNKMLRTMR